MTEMAVDPALELKKLQLRTAEAERRVQTDKLVKAARDMKMVKRDLSHVKHRDERTTLKKKAVRLYWEKKTLQSSVKVLDERIRSLRRQVQHHGR